MNEKTHDILMRRISRKRREMKKETELYHDLLRELRQYCTDNQLKHHITRIESNYTSQGIPDINCCIEGKEFWIEVKYDDIPNPMQISWKEQRQLAGGHVFTLQLNNKDRYDLWYKKDHYNADSVKAIVDQICYIMILT